MRKTRNANSSAIGTVITALRVRKASHVILAESGHDANPDAMPLSVRAPAHRSNANYRTNIRLPPMGANHPKFQSRPLYLDRKCHSIAAPAKNRSG